MSRARRFEGTGPPSPLTASSRPRVRRIIVGAAGVLVAGVLAVPAFADPVVWTVQPIPARHVANGALRAVSCATALTCVAIGNYAGTDGTPRSLAETWDGTHWTAVAVAEPSGARSDQLAAISCSSATFCMAVGQSVGGDGVPTALAETWDGSAWTVTASPHPGGAQSSQLTGVSCRSARICMVVGQNVDTSGVTRMLAESWHGTGWTGTDTVDVPGSLDSVLHAVSCSSSRSCVAVGAYTGSHGTPGTLAETWDGAHWSRSALPAGIGYAHLAGVSCTSRIACTAVGDVRHAGSAPSPLAVVWNGSAWTVSSIPVPGGAQISQLYSVSCTSSTACVAVGQWTHAIRTESALAEAWDGTSWHMTATTDPAGSYETELTGVSCRAPTACTAVGTYYRVADSDGLQRTLAQTWNGAWTIRATPNAVGVATNLLTDTSCISSSACMAVGHWFNASGREQTLAEVRKGSTWHLTASPSSGDGDSALASVSCVTASACTAVGHYDSGGVRKTLVEVWDGASWTIVTSPNPGGATSSELGAVSCASASACTAVGSYVNAAGAETPLAEAWNGRRWNLISYTHLPYGYYGRLAAVSCTAASSCTAVGVYYARNGEGGDVLTESWDGSSWQLTSPVHLLSPGPDGEYSYFSLRSVSCSAATFCIALGSRPMKWDGVKWTGMGTAALPLSFTGGLKDVSCTSSTSCTAVGSMTADYGRGQQATLAESYDGTGWSVVATPNPDDIADSGLLAVSCPTSATCIAVGSASYPRIGDHYSDTRSGRADLPFAEAIGT